MGWNAQPTRQVILEDARVPVANRLGDEGIGFKIAMAGLDGGRLNIGACSLGGAQAALDKALAYATDRKAFGQRHRRLPGAAVQARRHGDRARMRRAPSSGAPPRRSTPRRSMRRKLCAMAKRVATDIGLRGRQRGAADPRRLRLSRRLRHREDRARPARPPDPRRHQRDHAGDRGARPRRDGATRREPRRSGTASTSDAGEFTMTTIAFIGLGNMGGPMAANLVKAQHRVDRVRPRAGLLRPGAGPTASTVARSARGASRRPTWSSPCCRPAGTCSRSGPTSCRPSRAGALVIDCSTIDVDSARRRMRMARPSAASLSLDAPVSGGVGGAEGRDADLHGGRQRRRPSRAPSRSCGRWASASCIAARPAPARPRRSATT